MAPSFNTILPPFSRRPVIQGTALGELARTIGLLKDSLSLSSWLSVGALFQTVLLSCVPLAYALAPASLLLSYRLLTALLITLKILPNSYLSGVIMTRTIAQLPDRSGLFSSSPAAEPLAIFMIGAQCNHPLGMLAPGYKELGEWFKRMEEDLARSIEQGKSGYIGHSGWRSPTVANGMEFVGIFYFRSVVDVHAYGHGPLHKEARRWWDTNLKSHPHIGLWHETYGLEPGKWENIYLQCLPTGMGALAVPRRRNGKEDELTEWVRPLMEMSRGDRLSDFKARFSAEVFVV